jgi:hypothetical protein
VIHHYQGTLNERRNIDTSLSHCCFRGSKPYSRVHYCSILAVTSPFMVLHATSTEPSRTIYFHNVIRSVMLYSCFGLVLFCDCCLLPTLFVFAVFLLSFPNHSTPLLCHHSLILTYTLFQSHLVVLERIGI